MIMFIFIQRIHTKITQAQSSMHLHTHHCAHRLVCTSKGRHDICQPTHLEGHGHLWTGENESEQTGTDESGLKAAGAI